MHQAYVDVNEAGVEAAAATSVMIRPTGATFSSPKPIEFRVDRPFIVFIRDNRTGIVLFTANVVEP